jgi:hypothetical protein
MRVSALLGQGVFRRFTLRRRTDYRWQMADKHSRFLWHREVMEPRRVDL